MARTALPVTAISPVGANEVAGTAVDPTNGHYIDAGGRSGQLFIEVNNTVAATKVVTVKAGSNPPALRKSLGDLTFTVAASSRAKIGPIESGRFVQAPGGTDGGTGGRVFIDLAAGITGTIWAYTVPKAV